MSIQSWNHRGARFVVPIVPLVAGVVLGCASGGSGRQVRSSVHTEPTTVVSPSGSAGALENSAPPSLPPLPVGVMQQSALSAAPQQRINVLNVPAGTPIATAVTELAAKLGLRASIDPDVRGTAMANLRDVSVDEALRELVSRNGYAYQLQDDVLRVVPIRQTSRTFHLDYVAIARVGTMSTVVQRRLTNTATTQQPGTTTGLSPNAAGGIQLAGAGGDVLSAQSVADIWQEIRIALTGILQAGQPRGGVNPADQASNAATQTPGGGFGSGASSISFADGSNLVISPISGLINVTAMPDKLAAVERFIDDFQASVLRQVLIEAKIVEVTLTHSFQFGIDWNVVTGAASGKYGVTLVNDPSVQTTGNTGNVNFTFTGGTTKINAVLTALSTQGDVSVLSNEKTSALNNQRAIFDVTTDEIFFSVTRTPLFGPSGAIVTTQSQIIPQQISVGVVLDVLPQISADNVLTMNIRPAVTNIDHIETITLSDGTTASAPAIARREGDTIARLRAGETMIIGGLVQTRKDHTTSGIPLLRDIPYFGKAFTRINDTESRSELVVFLTPTIISGQPANPGR